jgi:Coenzyme PQQ synthesis protein D (PqqD)
MPTFLPESRPRRVDQVLSQQADDTLVLLNLENGQYFALSEVGGKIWELCDGRRSVSDIVDAVCSEYDATAETVEADVVELLNGLASERLVLECD